MEYFIQIIFVSFSSVLVESVNISIDYSQQRELEDFAKRVQDAQNNWFSYVSYLLRSPSYEPPQAFSIYFDPSYDGVAYISGSTIVGSANYYLAHQDDVGSMIHEMAHIIQNYNNTCYGWLSEGIADWIRFYHFEFSKQPNKPKPENNYLDGYEVSSYFLQWIQINIGDMVYWANKDCREGIYNDQLWPRLTGKTLNELWDCMMADKPMSHG